MSAGVVEVEKIAGREAPLFSTHDDHELALVRPAISC